MCNKTEVRSVMGYTLTMFPAKSILPIVVKKNRVRSRCPTLKTTQVTVPSKISFHKQIQIFKYMGESAPKCFTNTSENIDPKNVSASDRAKEFNNEMIVVSCGKLFCSAYREELSLKLSIIKNHVQSSKHADSKSKMGSAKKRERDISDALNLYEKEVNPSGESLPECHKLYCVKVVSTFLRDGVPLAKIEVFRDLLEENVQIILHVRLLTALRVCLSVG